MFMPLFFPSFSLLLLLLSWFIDYFFYLNNTFWGYISPLTFTLIEHILELLFNALIKPALVGVINPGCNTWIERTDWLGIVPGALVLFLLLLILLRPLYPKTSSLRWHLSSALGPHQTFILSVLCSTLDSRVNRIRSAGREKACFLAERSVLSNKDNTL